MTHRLCGDAEEPTQPELLKIQGCVIGTGEAGGITQQIGATFFPDIALQEQTKKVDEDFELEAGKGQRSFRSGLRNSFHTRSLTNTKQSKAWKLAGAPQLGLLGSQVRSLFWLEVPGLLIIDTPGHDTCQNYHFHVWGARPRLYRFNLLMQMQWSGRTSFQEFIPNRSKESFNNLRMRGSSLADLAILVIDIMCLGFWLD